MPTAILLIQLGTPDAPTSSALRRYLRQFLADPRVIESPWVRRLIIPAFVLPFRPARSAAKYQRVWNADTGSPLLHFTRLQAERLQEKFPEHPVRFGMQVGQPAVGDVVRELIASGIDRLIVVPMYPQYSATTTASATDALFQALMRERRVPALRIVPPYYAHPAYLDAQAARIQTALAQLDWEPEHFVLSYHGIPVSYAQRGDPYATHCTRTTRGLLARLQWPRALWTQSFQSRFGRSPWLKPDTESILIARARQGIRRIFVATPGFTTDCLETIDEIGLEAREVFEHAGGTHFHQCACLNADDAWIDALRHLVRDEGAGWLAADHSATT